MSELNNDNSNYNNTKTNRDKNNTSDKILVDVIVGRLLTAL
ncbi:MAG: hypothetical protein WBZ20_12110 [Nitrososphaeraceae archaeon]